jgi:hypothetical protein
LKSLNLEPFESAEITTTGKVSLKTVISVLESMSFCAFWYSSITISFFFFSTLKKKLAEYEAPAMDAAIKQELDEFVAKRSAELVK